MAKLQPIQIRTFERGIVQGVDRLLVPRDSVYLTQNMEFESKIGAAVIRPGSANAGGGMNAAGLVLGMHQFVKSDGTKVLLSAANDSGNSQVEKLSGGSWTNVVTGLTASLVFRFLTFLDTVVYSNGTDVASSSVDGTAWVTTGGNLDVDNFPKFKDMIEWHDRIYGFTNNSDRLQFSSTALLTLEYSTPSGDFTVGETVTDGTTGATGLVVIDVTAENYLVIVQTGDLSLNFGASNTITGSSSAETATVSSTQATTIRWQTLAGAGFIDIEPEDGGGTLQAVQKVPGYMLIFKERSMKRWNGVSTFPDDVVSIGTTGPRAVVRARDTVFFFNPKGIYETNGSYPVRRSRPINDFIKAIPSSYYANVSGWSDAEHVYFSIGDVIVDGITYSNAVVRYSLDTQQWAVYSYDLEPRAWSLYIDGTDEKIVFGTDEGNVVEINTGVTDSSTSEITFAVQTQELEIVPTAQEIDRVIVHTKNAKDAEVYVRVDHDRFESIGQIKDNNQEFNMKNYRGTVFEFRISGVSVGGNVEFYGLTFPEIDASATFK